MKRNVMTLAACQQLTCHPLMSEYCRDHSLTFTLVPFDHSEFQDVLDLRCKGYKSESLAESDPFDVYSEHYVAKIYDMPVASMRVTRKSCGPIECEEYFPQNLLLARSHQICSASRFAALPSVQSSTKVAQFLTYIVRIHQVTLGTRLDIINVHERAVKYYGKLGYELVANSFFLHPKLQTPSHIMILPVTPNREFPSKFVFEGITTPFEVTELAKYIQIAPWNAFRTSSKSDAR